MKKIPLALTSLLLLMACGQNTPAHKDGLTGKEDQALQEIKSVYGGQVNVSITPGPDGDKRYFHIAVSQSQVIREQEDLTGMFASHVAWLFFENISPEKDRYEGGEVTIQLSTGEAPVFPYSIQALEKVKKNMPVLERTVALLKAADYDGLHGLLAPERAGGTAREAIELDCGSLDQNNGRVTDFQFQGFGFFTPSGTRKEMLHLAGLLKRERYDTPLSLLLDPASPQIEGSLHSILFDY